MNSITEFVAVALFCLFCAGLALVLVVGWIRWIRQPQLQSLSLLGFVLGSASALLLVGTAFYARVIGGFRYYDPLLLKIYRWGFLLSFSGLGFGIAGVRRPNPLRVIAPLLSTGMFMLWVLQAAGE